MYFNTFHILDTVQSSRSLARQLKCNSLPLLFVCTSKQPKTRTRTSESQSSRHPRTETITALKTKSRNPDGQGYHVHVNLAQPSRRQLQTSVQGPVIGLANAGLAMSDSGAPAPALNDNYRSMTTAKYQTEHFTPLHPFHSFTGNTPPVRGLVEKLNKVPKTQKHTRLKGDLHL